MYRKILISLLFICSFFAITLGGYQCATKVTQIPREDIPIQTNPNDYSIETPDSSVESSVGSLPEEPEDRCARSQYRKLADRYGEIATLKLDRSSLLDYRLGKSENFEIKCAKMYLDMSKITSGSRAYKGSLRISYEDGSRIKTQGYTSGNSAEDNQYNKWTTGSWRASSRGGVDKEFYAIFDDEHAAIILQLKDVRVRELRDGENIYVGAGDIYFKTFRIWDGDNSDVCYTGATYVSQAHRQPPKNKRCWLLGTGPYSCRPQGALAPRARVTNIDIRGNLDCYSRLGQFFNLNLEEAFNVSDIEDI